MGEDIKFVFGDLGKPGGTTDPKEIGEDKMLYKRAWKVFGTHPQLDMIIEECCEMIIEVMSLKRARTTNLHPLVGEMVDVHIMTEQFLTVFNQYAWFNIIKREKLARLKRRLDDVEKAAKKKEV